MKIATEKRKNSRKYVLVITVKEVFTTENIYPDDENKDLPIHELFLKVLDCRRTKKPEEVDKKFGKLLFSLHSILFPEFPAGKTSK